MENTLFPGTLASSFLTWELARVELNQFSDYREYLRHRLDEAVSRNPRTSMRSFSKKIRMSPGHLSKVLSGKKGLSIEATANICESLGLSEPDTHYFCDLVQSIHGRSSAVRKMAKDRLNQYEPDPLNLDQDRFEMISDWYHYAILELTRVEGFRSDIRWIASQLGLTQIQAKLAVERLVNLGLLENREGRLRKSVNAIDTPAYNAAAIRKQYRQLLEKATDAVTTGNSDNRILSSVTMSIDPRKLKEARAMINRFKRRLCRFLEEGERTQVYCFSAQLFSLMEKSE